MSQASFSSVSVWWEFEIGECFSRNIVLQYTNFFWYSSSVSLRESYRVCCLVPVCPDGSVRRDPSGKHEISEISLKKLSQDFPKIERKSHHIGKIFSEIYKFCIQKRKIFYIFEDSFMILRKYKKSQITKVKTISSQCRSRIINQIFF